jgi:UDP-2,3-diacylglucosamine pyrophosphatase LpxH
MTILFLFLFLNIVNSLNCIVEQIHISQGLNPSSMTISWITKDNCFSNVAFSDNNKSLNNIVHGSSKSYEYYYNKSNSINHYKSGYIHHVLLTELEPSTKYYYICGDFFEQIFSKHLFFYTLPKRGDEKKITFAVLGDIGQTIHSVSTINNLLKEPSISMLLHAGDLSYADCNQELWDSYGKMIEPLSSSIPWMVCPGNHEIEFNGTDYMNLFTAFESRYRMPYIQEAVFGDIIIKSSINPRTGTPYCTPSIFQMEYNYGNSFYSFESGLAHIIFLNPYTNTSPTSQQFIWLENNLKIVDRESTPWVIVVMHCPWYSSNKNHYADEQTIEMRENMENLFYEYKVNLVFNGHVHDYERTYPVFRNDTDIYGTVYITIGNAGNLEGLDNNYVIQPKWSAFRNGTEYGYGLLTILNKKQLFWRWYINNGKQMLFRDDVLLCNTIYGDSNCFRK